MPRLLQIHEPGRTPDPHDETAAVGIDLGTTHSVAAIWHEGCPVAIESRIGSSVIPSIVTYLPDGTVRVGQRAAGAISSVKRLMGRSAAEARDLMPQLEILGDAAPCIRTPAGEKTPVEIAAEILKHLKAMAEEALGKEVKEAVITVPAYFDEAARLATRGAARLAGLEVLRLINEPTAAALAYGLESGAEGIYAMYDLGGGTFDISLLKLEGGVFQVLATAGDTALGGDDLDRRIADTFGLSLHAAREAKEALSEKEGGALSRDQLGALAKPLIDRTLTICTQAMEDAKLTQEDVRGVVLVGGSTRLRAVREAVEKYFGKKPLLDIDPDRVVAYGAAIQAHQLSQGEGDHLLLDVVPLSLGLETMGDLVEKLIYRNTPIPVAVSQEFTTYEAGQTGMQLHIVQGEREMASQCRSLARFELTGIPPMVAGAARVRVTFQVDADGLLTVSAEETTTGITQHIEVKPSYGLPFGEIERMLAESMENARADITARLLAEAKLEARRTLSDLDGALAVDTALLDRAENEKIAAARKRLEAALAQDDRDLIDALHQELQHATAAFAEKRMDKAIGQALKGTHVEDI